MLHSVVLLAAAAALSTGSAKGRLFAAIGDLKREPSVARRKAVLAAVEAVEASGTDAGTSAIEGRWSLIFSTQISAREEQRLTRDNALLQSFIDTTSDIFVRRASHDSDPHPNPEPDPVPGTQRSSRSRPPSRAHSRTAPPAAPPTSRSSTWSTARCAIARRCH